MAKSLKLAYERVQLRGFQRFYGAPSPTGGYGRWQSTRRNRCRSDESLWESAVTVSAALRRRCSGAAGHNAPRAGGSARRNGKARCRQPAGEVEVGQVCWTFDLTTKGITGASIHTGQKGPVLVSLGKTYTKKGCTKTSAMTLEHLETKPGSYWVFVDTKGHPGDLRGSCSPAWHTCRRETDARSSSAVRVAAREPRCAATRPGRVHRRRRRRSRHALLRQGDLARDKPGDEPALGRDRPHPPIPSSGWRIYTVANSMPTFDPTTWRLRVDGLVRQPLELSYDQLRALPKARQVSTFHCVTGWVVDNVHWGVSASTTCWPPSGRSRTLAPCTSSPPSTPTTTTSICAR